VKTIAVIPNIAVYQIVMLSRLANGLADNPMPNWTGVYKAPLVHGIAGGDDIEVSLMLLSVFVWK